MSPSSPKKVAKRFLVLPEFVTPEQLVAEIKQPSSSILIFDVRDQQEIAENGRIINSLNIPSTTLLNNLERVYEEHKNVEKVYFHCALSQVRGPKCAQHWANLINEKEHRTEQQVFILKGGFDQFKGRYGTDTTVTEGVKFGY